VEHEALRVGGAVGREEAPKQAKKRPRAPAAPCGAMRRLAPCSRRPPRLVIWPRAGLGEPVAAPQSL
jgi:hypothetical protein